MICGFRGKCDFIIFVEKWIYGFGRNIRLFGFDKKKWFYGLVRKKYFAVLEKIDFAV